MCGTHGIVGLELRFAFLVLPVVLAWRRQKLLRTSPDGVLLAALMAVVSMRAIDLIPNGFWNYLPVFLAGALFSFSQHIGRRQTSPRRINRPVGLTTSGSLGQTRVRVPLRNSGVDPSKALSMSC